MALSQPPAGLLRLARQRLRGLYFGWYIAMAGALSGFLVMGLTVYGFGVFIRPVTKELGWSVAAVSAAFSIRQIEQGLMSPVGGYAVDRFGPRKVALAGIVFMAIGLVLFSQVHSLWMLYLSAIMMALGQSVGPLRAFTAAVVTWFARLRGRALGVVQIGNGMGPFAVPLLGFLVAAIGWRETLLVLAVLIPAVTLPLTMVLRRAPEPYGYRADGVRISDAPAVAANKPRMAQEPSGMSVGEAMRTPAFYLLGLAFALGTMVLNTWIVHQVAHLESAGFSTGAIGGIIAMYGGVAVPTRLLVGWLGDYIGHRKLFGASFALVGIGVFIAANLTPDRLWLLPIFLATMPVGHAALGLSQTTVVVEYFGVRRFNTIAGAKAAISLPFSLGGPIVAGWMFDQMDSYRLAFMIYAPMVACATLLVLLARRPKPKPDPDRDSSPI